MNGNYDEKPEMGDTMFVRLHEEGPASTTGVQIRIQRIANGFLVRAGAEPMYFADLDAALIAISEGTRESFREGMQE